MVTGFESFRTHFQGYEDCYTIIGGTACDILMGDAALPFRATRDIDMILLIENRFEEFAPVFWRYVRAGGYRCGWRNSDVPHFYRFTEPRDSNYPKMIELFSRRPDFQLEQPEIHLTPLPVSEDISSLSAIMLKDDYYDLMLSGRRTVDGVSVLDAEYLIAFKAKAWLDLTARKAKGEHVNERDLKKHKNDVFRLFAIVDPERRITVSLTVSADLASFIAAMEHEQIDLRSLGVEDVTVPEILSTLQSIVSLNGDTV